MTFGRIIAHDGLKLRKGAGTKSVALDLMPEGDRVKFLDEPNKAGWSHVRWLPESGPELEGWAWGEYIEVEPEFPEPRKSDDARTAWGIAAVGMTIALVALLLYAFGGS